MAKMINLWLCIIIFLIGSSLRCTSKGAKSEKKVEKDSCITLYAEDKLTYKIFSDMYVTDFGQVSSKVAQVNISFEPVKNTFDSTRIDSVINIKTGNTIFKYYSRKESKVLLEARLSDNKIPISSEIKIGMSYSAFVENVLKKYFKQEITERWKCIDITTSAEYENLHFLFDSDKLISFTYTNNIETFR